MTSNAARATALMRALEAGLAADGSAIRDLYTEDVKAWTPALSASSLGELVAEFDRRDQAFSDIELEVAPEVVEPTGARITVNGATVAEFRGDRICSLRQYWDELAVFEQIGLMADDGA